MAKDRTHDTGSIETMTSLAVYHRTVPNNKNQEKIDLLNYFSEGARKCGDAVIDVQDHLYHGTDVAVIQGWITQEKKTRPHLVLRDTVIKNQLRRNRYVVAVDSNLFLYANTRNPLHYLRYSFNGVFANTGIYCDTHVDPQRWQKISGDLGISLKPYRNNGSHILLCMQRNGGWSMNGQHVLDWAATTILEIRNWTNRPIVIRPHPGDKAAAAYIGRFDSSGDLHNVSVSRAGTTLQDDLRNCWAVVNHNSSPAVAAAIEGYPVFVTDPERSQCREIANTDLSRIESPVMPDRQAWIERLAMSHWNFDELRSGEAWSHMRKFIANAP
jgi:hypothetical protein